MARYVFISFDFATDFFRVQQLRQAGALSDGTFGNFNDWEKVKKQTDQAIKQWIGTQMGQRSTVVVLIGPNTANSRWVLYEIEKAYNENRAVLGVRIHQLKDQNGQQGQKGVSPFQKITLGRGKSLANVLPVFQSEKTQSDAAYREITQNISSWIEKEISRQRGS